MIERQTRLTILLPNPNRQPKALAERIGQAWQGCRREAVGPSPSTVAANRRIRRFLPGERNLSKPDENELRQISATLNSTPRRCLGYPTP